jgi:hypothetical protein
MRRTPPAWQPVDARVLWRAERHGDERPEDVLYGGELFHVVRVLDTSVETGVAAGSPLARVLVVLDQIGQVWRVLAVAGAVEVELSADSRLSHGSNQTR